MSRQVTDALSNDLVILGGLIGNEIAESFTARLCEAFDRPIFHFNDVDTMDVTLDGYTVEGFDLQLNKAGTITRDLGVVIIWRNPFTDDWRRAVMCIGFSTYGTADAAQWVFEELIPGNIGVWVKTFKRYGRARRCVRQRECCLALLEFQYGGGPLQVPLGIPKLRYFGHFTDPTDSLQREALALVKTYEPPSSLTMELLRLAIDAATDAAALVLKKYSSEHSVRFKQHGEIVTDVNLEAEHLIRRQILSARADDGFLGEEGEPIRSQTGITWLVDPIDGTTNYVRKLPGFMVSIAASWHGTTLAAAVCDPVHHITYTAAHKVGAFSEGKAIHVSSSNDLGNALIGTGFSIEVDKRLAQARLLTKVSQQVGDIRCFGVCSYDPLPGCGRRSRRLLRGSLEIMGLCRWFAYC